MSVQLVPEHFKAILENLPNGLYIVDQERRILFWNKGAEQITGYRSPEVIGRFCQDNLLMHCDENYAPLCGCHCPLQETMVDGRPREARVYLRHKNGQRVPVNIRAVPVRNADGGIIGAAESFDERHETTESLVHLNAQAVQNHMDDRTGVSDHGSTKNYLEACLRDYQENHIPFGVLMIRIDDLELFRQAHGTQAAVNVLQAVAATLSKNLRDGDIVGHWIEGRFLALVVNCPESSLARLIFMLKRVVSVADVPWWGERLAITISIGGTAVRPDDSVDSLLARSEKALLACIDKGGNSGDVL